MTFPAAVDKNIRARLSVCDKRWSTRGLRAGLLGGGGGMAEWSKAAVLKTADAFGRPWVRILLPPRGGEMTEWPKVLAC